MYSSRDLKSFIDQCVFIRSVYEHARILFGDSSPSDRERMTRSAPTFFGDLNQILNEYIILQICKITDPARDFRSNENHTIAFFLEHYDFSSNPSAFQRLRELDGRLQVFRQRLLPARNKLISHSDRTAILAGKPLGDALPDEWQQFWLDLQETICLIHKVVAGEPFHLNDVSMLSDADGLLKALQLAHRPR
jgi:hypothetical protein